MLKWCPTLCDPWTFSSVQGIIRAKKIELDCRSFSNLGIVYKNKDSNFKTSEEMIANADCSTLPTYFIK